MTFDIFHQNGRIGKESVKCQALTPSIVRVSYSARRKRTVAARLDGDVLSVTAPSGINRQRLEKIVEDLKGRIIRSHVKGRADNDKDLYGSAESLNKRFFDGKLDVRSIKYSSSQRKRYGSCNHITGEIRISDRLREMPAWVRDYVIIHEMAHLVEPDHGRAFRELVSRYKLAERARGYLMGVSANRGKPE